MTKAGSTEKVVREIRRHTRTAVRAKNGLAVHRDYSLAPRSR